MQSDEEHTQHQVHAFTVTGYGGLCNVFTAEELQAAMRLQLIEDTIFRVFVFQTSYSDTRTGEGIYSVVDEKMVLVEEFGVCVGVAARMLPECSLMPKPPSTILRFPDKADHHRGRKDSHDTSPPQDEMEEERRCNLLRAFPYLGDYRIIAIFVALLDDCVGDLQREGTTVSAEAITARTHFTLELSAGYVAILEDQQSRMHAEG